MILLHMADLHLDSRLSSRLDREKASLRRSEILHTFERAVEYAAEKGAAGILIAGDLFDRSDLSVHARRTVEQCIRRHPEILFFYLKGNHDHDAFLSSLTDAPENLKLFDDRWTNYRLGRVSLWGMELTAENAATALRTLPAEQNTVRIVMLHGQEAESAGSRRSDPVIDLRDLRHRGIDYLALGHVHAYRRERLDARGVWCYPGCLDGRGFDECGDHGFVELDIDEESGRITDRFVPFASRRLHAPQIDISGVCDTPEAAERIEAVLESAAIPPEDLVKLVLTGAVSVSAGIDLTYLETRFKDRFFYLTAEDATRLQIDAADYYWDESLRGEFVRTVMADPSVPEARRASVIRLGLLALSGEEVSL